MAHMHEHIAVLSQARHGFAGSAVTGINKRAFGSVQAKTIRNELRSAVRYADGLYAPAVALHDLVRFQFRDEWVWLAALALPAACAIHSDTAPVLGASDQIRPERSTLGKQSARDIA